MSRLAFFRETLSTIRTVWMLRTDQRVLIFVFLSFALSRGLTDRQLYMPNISHVQMPPESHSRFLALPPFLSLLLSPSATGVDLETDRSLVSWYRMQSLLPFVIGGAVICLQITALHEPLSLDPSFSWMKYFCGFFYIYIYYFGWVFVLNII